MGWHFHPINHFSLTLEQFYPQQQSPSEVLSFLQMSKGNLMHKGTHAGWYVCDFLLLCT